MDHQFLSGFNGNTDLDSPGDTPDHCNNGGAGDGYGSEDFVAGSGSSRERKKGSCFLRLFLCFDLFYVLIFG